MEGFTFEEVENLSKLLNLNNEIIPNLSSNSYYNKSTGSVLKPHNIEILNNRGEIKEKELARPYAKIEQKYNNRILSNPDNQIWSEDDFKEENIEETGKEKPDFEIFYKQDVGVEDVYFGLNGKDISSNSCDQLSIRIKLPNTNLKEISIEVKSESIHLNTPKYVLNQILQYKVNKDKSNAKWDKEKETLSISLPIIKKSIYDCFDGENN